MLIVNTSDMPAAAWGEALIYTGITIAEYFQGHVGYSSLRWQTPLPVGLRLLERCQTSGGDACEEGYPAHLKVPVWHSSTSVPAVLSPWPGQPRGRSFRYRSSIPPQAAIFRAGYTGYPAYRKGILSWMRIWHIRDIFRHQLADQLPRMWTPWKMVQRRGESDRGPELRARLMRLLQEESELNETYSW